MKKNTKIILIALCILIIGVVGGTIALNHKKSNSESQNKTKSVVNSDEKNKENSQTKEENKKVEIEKKGTIKQGMLYKNLDEGIKAFNTFFYRLDGGKGLYKLTPSKKSSVDIDEKIQQNYFSVNSNITVAFDTYKSTGECFQVHISSFMDGSKQCLTDSKVIQFAAMGALDKNLSEDDIMSASEKLMISNMITSNEEKIYEDVINGMTYQVNKSRKNEGAYSISISITKKIYE